MIYNDENDTIAVAITPLTQSAVGIIRVSGSDCFYVVAKVFRPIKSNHKLNIANIVSHTVQYGFIYDHEELLDEVMVSFFRAPRSYTCEDIAEISCHGNPIIIDRVLLLLIKLGVRLAEPGEFTKRAFLNGRIDLSRAEAVMELISAESIAATRNAQKLLNGKFSKEISNIAEKILDEIAFIESSLDDPENYDYDKHKDLFLNNIKEVLDKIEVYIKSYDYGCLLKNGIKVLFVGSPNVGKSSLFNRLVNEERSIVTDIAGTTRDMIESAIHVNDLLLRIIDSAGIIETNNPVEKIGVSRVLSLIPRADLIFYCIDITSDLNADDFKIIELIKDKKTIIILNKIDLCNVHTSHKKEDDIVKFFPQGTSVVSTSAIENIGIEALKTMVYNLFTKGGKSAVNDLTLTNTRHFNLLCLSKNTLNKMIEDFKCGYSEDLLVIGLVDVYNHLCEILGKNISDDIVNRVFEKFCVGK